MPRERAPESKPYAGRGRAAAERAAEGRATEGRRKGEPGKPARARATLRARLRALPLRLAGAVLLGVLLAAGATSAAMVGCSGWDPRRPFERHSPEVKQAIVDLDGGRLEPAEETLERYLATGACGDAGLGLPDAVRQKPNGSFDLGLTLFYMAERYGQRFGDEDVDGGPADEARAGRRGMDIDCALILLKAIGSDPSVPLEIRARARYLAGNLEFMRKKYEDAVKQYDQALELVPGLYEEAGGDGIGRDAAWNRAIALRRIEDQKDAGNDASDTPDSSDKPDGNDGDASPDGSNQPDGGDDAGGDDAGGADAGAPDAGQDAGEAPDAGQDAGQSPPPPPPPSSSAEAAPPPQQDDRLLDQLEEAPTYQEQEAKARAGQRRGRAMEDK